MSALSHYFQAQAYTKLYQAKCGQASAQLEVAQMRERQAEIDSQAEPLRSRILRLVNDDPSYDDVRKLINAAAFYVIVGRWPEEPK